MNNTLSTGSFIAQRAREIQELAPRVRKLEKERPIASNKRRFSSLFYKTRSFRTYKTPRREKNQKKNNAQLVLSKNGLPGKLKMHRVNRRRQLKRLCPIAFSHHSPENLTVNAPMRLPGHVFNRKRMIMGIDSGFYVPLRSSYRGLKAVDRLLLGEGGAKQDDENEEKAHNSIKDRAYVHDMSYCRPIQLLGPYNHVHSALSMITDPHSALVCEVEGRVGQDERQREPPKGGLFERTILVYEPQCFPRCPLGVVDVTVSVYKENVQVLFWPLPALLSQLFRALTEAAALEGAVLVSMCPTPLCRVSVGGKGASQCLLKVLHSSDDSASSAAKGYAFFREVLGGGTARLNNVWQGTRVLTLRVLDPRTPPSPAPRQSLTSLRWPGALFPYWSHRTPPLENSSVSVARDHELHARRHAAKAKTWMLLEKAWGVNPSSSASAPQSAADPQSLSWVRQQLFPATASSSGIPSALPEAPSDAADRLKQDVWEVSLVHHHSPCMSSFFERHPSPLFSLLLSPQHTHAIVPLLVKNGQAIALGVEEVAHLRCRSSCLTFPQDYPDTPAGWAWMCAQWQQVCASREKRPGGKKQLGVFGKRERKGVGGISFPLVQAWLRRSSKQEEGEDAEDMQVEDTGDGRSSSARPQFLVVRDRRYLDGFVPPSFTPAPPLPAMADLTLLHVQLAPLSRGLPRSGALILLPLQGEQVGLAKGRGRPGQERYRGGVHLAVQEQRALFKAMNQAEALGKSGDWGEVLDCVGRPVVGFITSGIPAHTNIHRYAYVGIGLVHAEMLYEHLAGKLDDERVVLFWNYGSAWLRPALIKLLI